MPASIMPAIFIEIRKAIGAENALKLIRAMGGSRVYFPTLERLTPKSDLSQALGMACATRLVRAVFGDAHMGQQLSLPTLSFVERCIRRERVIELIGDAGLSSDKIARITGSSRRNVEMLRARRKNGMRSA